MSIRKILVPVFQDADFSAQLEAAYQLARKDGAHINAVFMRPDAIALAATMPDMLVAAGITIDQIEGEGRAAEAAAKAKFEAWRQANDIGVEAADDGAKTASASWRERVGPVESVVVELGRVSDITILNRPDNYDAVTYRAFDAAVFETGRPTLIVPETVPENLLHQVIVAWNSSIEVTRAVAGAMPLLSAADHVSVFTAPAHTDEAIRDLHLGEQLAWHGIRAHYLPATAATESVGPALLKAATDHHATMLVMGAYTHSRIRELLLGGVTRHIVRHTHIPVLMMH